MEDRLRNVEDKITRVEVLLEELLLQNRQLNSLLMGKDGQPGIVVRVDRLEQAAHRMAKAFWLVAGVAVTALTKVFMP